MRTAPRRPFHPLDKRYRAGGVPRVGVHFLNDRPRSVEELDAELHRQRPRRRSTSASESGSVISGGGGGSRAISIRVAVSSADRVACSLGHYQRDAPPVSGRASLMRRPVGQDHVTFASASLPIGRAAMVAYQRLGVGVGQPSGLPASVKPKDNCSRVLFVLRSSVAGGLRVRLAHVGALLRVAVVAPSREVVNV